MTNTAAVSAPATFASIPRFVVSIAFNHGRDRASLREISTHRTISGAVRAYHKAASYNNGWAPEVAYFEAGASKTFGKPVLVVVGEGPGEYHCTIDSKGIHEIICLLASHPAPCPPSLVGTGSDSTLHRKTKP